MASFDLATLPDPLAAYFAAKDRRTLGRLFAPEAVVIDEGETLREPQAIARWLNSVETRYQPRYAVTSATTVGDQAMVSFMVSGTFPGSPLALRQAFDIHDGKIVRLETL